MKKKEIKNYSLGLNRKEAIIFYETLNYYGYGQVIDAAYNMFTREQTPLPQHWENDKDFLKSFYLFHDLAKDLKKDSFIQAITKIRIPQSLKIDKNSKKIITSNKLFTQESRNLFDFLNHMDKYFEYETTLISLGYPPDDFEKHKKKAS
jgi:hypothetical protein